MSVVTGCQASCSVNHRPGLVVGGQLSSYVVSSYHGHAYLQNRFKRVHCILRKCRRLLERVVLPVHGVPEVGALMQQPVRGVKPGDWSETVERLGARLWG